MPIIYHEETKTFHLFNKTMSYLIKVLKNDQIGNLYVGKRIADRPDFDHLFELEGRGMAVCVFEGDRTFSLDHIKREYPTAFSGDMRLPALDILQENGSRVLDLKYLDHKIIKGKPILKGLPATYTEDEKEATTLVLALKDPLLDLRVELLYTIFEERPVLTRSARAINEGKQKLKIESIQSISLDLPDSDYEMMTLTGAWSRERQIKVQPLHEGIQSIYSIRGHSSSQFNPFIALKKDDTKEETGEVFGFSLVYSGNFNAQVDVDTFNTTRIQMGIHPLTFSWPLEPDASFQSPEAVLVYTDEGLNKMSQTFHTLFRERLMRGPWKNRVRPILINNWEGTYFDFNEQKIVAMAKEAKKLGIELFVLDDGWFKGRNDDTTSLGDWIEDESKLPNGLKGLSKKIKALGMDFGIWIEPEMVNKRSDLYRNHPDWVLHTPNRAMSHGRNQYVLDYANPEVVEAIYQQLIHVFDPIDLSYIKWDMNRAMSEVYSTHFPAEEQGTIYHRYILGVYSLYERLIERYPDLLFESCASGGARFDPGMLYYAPQAWTSDDTDAIERIKIQYGTSMLYPICSMGSHVSAIPNHQLYRSTPLQTRADVAYFGTFGYELDPLKLTDHERGSIQKQIEWMKEHRKLIQFGTFYRLRSPFDGNECAWMIVSPDQKEALVGYYRILQEVNTRFRRLKLQGLDPDRCYEIHEKYEANGDELMYAGLVISDASAGEKNLDCKEGDYLSRIYVLSSKDGGRIQNSFK